MPGNYTVGSALLELVIIFVADVGAAWAAYWLLENRIEKRRGKERERLILPLLFKELEESLRSIKYWLDFKLVRNGNGAHVVPEFRSTAYYLLRKREFWDFPEADQIQNALHDILQICDDLESDDILKESTVPERVLQKYESISTRLTSHYPTYLKESFKELLERK